MSILLFVLGALLLVGGVYRLVQRDLLWGIILVVLGLIVIPGGVYLG